MKSNLLKKIKNSLIQQEESIDIDGVDLDSGTIIIEATEPQKIVSTKAVLHKSSDLQSDMFFRGYKGMVFVLDLNPFFSAIGTTATSRIGDSLNIFAETILTRELGDFGTLKNHNNEQFFFRISKNDAEGWVMAAKAVNAIGEHFLRDAFKSDDMISKSLSCVNPKDLIGSDGKFDGAKALKNKITVTSVKDAIEKSEGPLWQILKYDGIKPKVEPNTNWQTEAKAMRSALDKVIRGPARRLRLIKAPARMERRNSLGRRDSDNPKKSIW